MAKETVTGIGRRDGRKMSAVIILGDTDLENAEYLCKRWLEACPADAGQVDESRRLAAVVSNALASCAWAAAEAEFQIALASGAPLPERRHRM